jgi:hypothetical protein
MTEYTNFRQRLDAVLRTLDVKQVSDFLIAEKQWQPGHPSDPTYAMWMMIAGSQTLRDLHQQARQWLVAHGHEEEANAVLRGGKGSSQGKKKSQKGKTKS